MAVISKPPEPRIGEHRLGHHRTADEIRHHQADDRDERQESIAQDMAADDVPFAQALRARGAHIIGLQFADQRCAQEPREDARDIDARASAPAARCCSASAVGIPRRAHSPTRMAAIRSSTAKSRMSRIPSQKVGTPSARALHPLEDPIEPGIRDKRTGHCDRNPQAAVRSTSTRPRAGASPAIAGRSDPAPARGCGWKRRDRPQAHRRATRRIAPERADRGRIAWSRRRSAPGWHSRRR